MGEKSFRFARNFSWNMLGQTVLLALNFSIIPYLIRRMGVETYGLYILMHTLAAYPLLLSLGSGTTAITYVAGYRASGNRRALRRTVSYALGMHAGGAGLAALALIAGGRFFVIRVFHVPDAQVDTGLFVLYCAALGSVFACATQASLCVFQGLQKFAHFNILTFFQNGMMPLGAAFCIERGWGIRPVAVWYVALNAGLCLLSLALMRKDLEDGAEPGDGSLPSFRSLLVWGLSPWLSSLAAIVILQFDKLFILRMISLSDLTLYSVPAGLLQRLQIVSGMMSMVVTPMMSELGAHSREDLRRMYLKSVKFLLWLALPVLALLFCAMPQFLSLWLGSEFGLRSVWPARVLLMAQVFFFLNATPTIVAVSRGKPWYMTAAAWSQALISVLCWRFLTPRFGILGVALGALAAQAGSGIFFVSGVHRKLMDLSARRYLAEGVLPPAISALIMTACVFPFHAWAGTWPKMALFFAAGGLVYYASTWLLLGDQDRDLAKKFFAYERTRARAS